jgi:hypothetical protein
MLVPEADGSNDKVASFSAILKVRVNRCALLTLLRWLDRFVAVKKTPQPQLVGDDSSGWFGCLYLGTASCLPAILLVTRAVRGVHYASRGAVAESVWSLALLPFCGPC